MTAAGTAPYPSSTMAFHEQPETNSFMDEVNSRVSRCTDFPNCLPGSRTCRVTLLGCNRTDPESALSVRGSLSSLFGPDPIAVLKEQCRQVKDEYAERYDSMLGIGTTFHCLHIDATAGWRVAWDACAVDPNEQPP